MGEKIILFVSDESGTIWPREEETNEFLAALLSEVKDTYGADKIIFGISTGARTVEKIEKALDGLKPYFSKYQIEIGKSYTPNGNYYNGKFQHVNYQGEGKGKLALLCEYINELEDAGYEIKWVGYADDNESLPMNAIGYFNRAKPNLKVNTFIPGFWSQMYSGNLKALPEDSCYVSEKPQLEGVVEGLQNCVAYKRSKTSDGIVKKYKDNPSE